MPGDRRSKVNRIIDQTLKRNEEGQHKGVALPRRGCWREPQRDEETEGEDEERGKEEETEKDGEEWQQGRE